MALFRKRHLDDDLQEELRSHLEMAIDLNLRHGMTPEQARREAFVAFGGIEQTKQIYREQRGLPMVETVLKDLRYGWRMLRLNPGFTTVTVLSLALGRSSANWPIRNRNRRSVGRSSLSRPFQLPRQ